MQGNKSGSVGVADCDAWQPQVNARLERLFQLAHFDQRFPFGNLVQLCKDADTVAISNEFICSVPLRFDTNRLPSQVKFHEDYLQIRCSGCVVRNAFR